MFVDLLPFWSKWWYHIFFTIIICVISKYFMKNMRNSKKIKVEEFEDDGPEISQENESFKNPALPENLPHIPYKFIKPSEEKMRQDSLNFYNVVNARRTLRFFSSQAVPRDIIHNIIKAAGTSPSGAHTEPWTFVLVSSPTVKAKIREIVEREEELNYNKRMGKKWTTDLKPLKTDWVKDYLTEAPYLICLFKQTYGLSICGSIVKKQVHYYHEMSVSIAAGILITAIQFAGLVTLTSTPLNCGPALRQLLDRPINEKLALLLPVGFPAAHATVPDLTRKPLSQILIEIQ